MPLKIGKINALLQTAFVLIAVLGAAYYMCKHWHDVVTVWNQSSAAGLGLAVVVTTLGYILRGVMWSPLLHAVTGIYVPSSVAFRISSISWMGRYLPGKIWTVAGKAYLSTNGNSVTGAAGSVLAAGVAAAIDLIWLLVSGAMVALLCGGLTLRIDGGLRQYFLVAAIALPVGILLCHPAVYCPLANQLLKFLKKPPLPKRPSFAVMLLLLATNSVSFLLWSLGLALLLSPYVAVTASSFCTIAMTFVIAWVCGLLALFAPAGIGVRETIIAIGLNGFLGLGGATVVVAVVGSRVLTTIAELLCFGIALMIKDRRNAAAVPHLQETDGCQ
jgi:hypothetical protein